MQALNEDPAARRIIIAVLCRFLRFFAVSYSFVQFFPGFFSFGRFFSGFGGFISYIFGRVHIFRLMLIEFLKLPYLLLRGILRDILVVLFRERQHFGQFRGSELCVLFGHFEAVSAFAELIVDCHEP